MTATAPGTAPVATADSARAARPDRWGTFAACLATRAAIRAGLAAYAVVLAAVARRRPTPRPIGARGVDVLLTGTFHSANWVESHLRPLARSGRCRRVRVVAISPVPAIPKVEAICPPAWLVRVAGAAGARLAVFGWTALRERPDVLGGFHLLLNGLAAVLLARLTSARSLYFCVGGPAEVLDGGLQSENRLFERLRWPDPVVERRLLRSVAACDVVVAMGTRAVRFFRERGVESALHVVAGGIDSRRFSATPACPDLDVVFVGRLAPIKRLDLLLDALACVRAVRPGMRAAIVGDGPLRAGLEHRARALGLDGHVTFAGQQGDVESWLRRARVFVLTSATEGLALSMIEAMLCGLPVVVPPVGDLADLVEDGVNGCVVAERTAEAFAGAVLALLGDETRRRALGQAARRAAERHAVGTAARAWDAILEGLTAGDAEGTRPCAA